MAAEPAGLLAPAVSALGVPGVPGTWHAVRTVATDEAQMMSERRREIARCGADWWFARISVASMGVVAVMNVPSELDGTTVGPFFQSGRRSHFRDAT